MHKKTRVWTNRVVENNNCNAIMNSSNKGLCFLPLDLLTSVLRRFPMIRKLKSGEYRLYSEKKNPKTGKRRNLGTFKTRAAAVKHEREVQYFKHR